MSINLRGLLADLKRGSGGAEPPQEKKVIQYIRPKLRIRCGSWPEADTHIGRAFSGSSSSSWRRINCFDITNNCWESSCVLVLKEEQGDPLVPSWCLLSPLVLTILPSAYYSPKCLQLTQVLTIPPRTYHPPWC